MNSALPPFLIVVVGELFSPLCSPPLSPFSFIPGSQDQCASIRRSFYNVFSLSLSHPSEKDRCVLLVLFLFCCFRIKKKTSKEMFHFVIYYSRDYVVRHNVTDNFLDWIFIRMRVHIKQLTIIYHSLIFPLSLHPLTLSCVSLSGFPETKKCKHLINLSENQFKAG